GGDRRQRALRLGQPRRVQEGDGRRGRHRPAAAATAAGPARRGEVGGRRPAGGRRVQRAAAAGGGGQFFQQAAPFRGLLPHRGQGGGDQFAAGAGAAAAAMQLRQQGIAAPGAQGDIRPARRWQRAQDRERGGGRGQVVLGQGQADAEPGQFAQYPWLAAVAA